MAILRRKTGDSSVLLSQGTADLEQECVGARMENGRLIYAQWAGFVEADQVDSFNGALSAKLEVDQYSNLDEDYPTNWLGLEPEEYVQGCFLSANSASGVNHKVYAVTERGCPKIVRL